MLDHLWGIAYDWRMRSCSAVLIIMCLLAGCLRGTESTSDVLLTRAITLGNNDPGKAGVVYWGSRIWVTDDAKRRLIFDREARTITFVDKRTQTYVVRTFDEVSRKREIQQKYRAERATTKPGVAPITLTKTENITTIAGYPAREYTFTTAAVRGAVWVSDAVRPPAPWRPWQGLIAYLDGAFAGGEDVMEAVATLDGYPLRTSLTFGDGPGAWTITTQVAQIAPVTTPGDLATVPENFRRENEIRG